jgi:hypothetical protein
VGCDCDATQQETDDNAFVWRVACRTITGCGGLQHELQALWGFPYWGPPGFNRQVISGPSWGDFRSFPTEELETFLKNSEQ